MFRNAYIRENDINQKHSTTYVSDLELANRKVVILLSNGDAVKTVRSLKGYEATLPLTIRYGTRHQYGCTAD